MIRHRPAGRGHPYEADDEQRFPLLPLAGELVEIRATSEASLDAAHLELASGDRVPLDERGAPSPCLRRMVTGIMTA